MSIIPVEYSLFKQQTTKKKEKEQEKEKEKEKENENQKATTNHGSKTT